MIAVCIYGITSPEFMFRVWMDLWINPTIHLLGEFQTAIPCGWHEFSEDSTGERCLINSYHHECMGGGGVWVQNLCLSFCRTMRKGCFHYVLFISSPPPCFLPFPYFPLPLYGDKQTSWIFNNYHLFSLWLDFLPLVCFGCGFPW